MPGCRQGRLNTDIQGSRAASVTGDAICPGFAGACSSIPGIQAGCGEAPAPSLCRRPRMKLTDSLSVSHLIETTPHTSPCSRRLLHLAERSPVSRLMQATPHPSPCSLTPPQTYDSSRVHLPSRRPQVMNSSLCRRPLVHFVVEAASFHRLVLQRALGRVVPPAQHPHARYEQRA